MYGYYRKAQLRRIEDRLNRKKALSEQTTSRWESLKHPLVTIAFGFILTGLLGSYLNNRYQSDAKERERVIAERKQNYDLSLKSIEDFANLLYARRTRAAMLHSAIKRGSTKDEIAQKKRDYDIAYAEWNSKLQTTLFGIRRITKANTYSQFENLVETKLRQPFLLLDTCLTDAYDTNIGIRNKREYRCDTEKLLTTALNCSYAMSDELYKFVFVDEATEIDRDVRIKDASLEIDDRCDVSNISVEKDASEPAKK